MFNVIINHVVVVLICYRKNIIIQKIGIMGNLKHILKMYYKIFVIMLDKIKQCNVEQMSVPFIELIHMVIYHPHIKLLIDFIS